MSSNKKLDISTLNQIGIYKHDSFFDNSFIEKLGNRCEIIYNAEKFLSKFGLGNCSSRNGSLFTGNLLLKSSIFIELAVVLQKFIKSNNLKNYFLSEFFIVSTDKYNNFSDWWHRDYPHDKENFEFYNRHSIGFFIPISKFNELTGSTKVVEYSNNDLTLSPTQKNIKILSANKGDLIIYDPKLIHTGGSNKTDETRQLIIALFNRKELIPCEDFQIQTEMIFKDKDKKLLKEINLIRYKPMVNFFGRNRSIIDTSLRPIIKVINKFKRNFDLVNSLIYFSWTRLLYWIFNLIKKD